MRRGVHNQQYVADQYKQSYDLDIRQGCERA